MYTLLPKEALNDGYTKEAVVTDPGVKPFKIKYRPTLSSEYRQRLEAVVADHDEANKFLKEKLREWDVVDSGGNPAPISEESFALMEGPVHTALVNCVLGLGKDQAELDEAQKN